MSTTKIVLITVAAGAVAYLAYHYFTKPASEEKSSFAESRKKSLSRKGRTTRMSDEEAGCQLQSGYHWDGRNCVRNSTSVR